MKIIALVLAFCCVAGFSSCAGNKKNMEKDRTSSAMRDSTYEVALVFGSMCCGTASADFVDQFLIDYDKRSSTQKSVEAAVAEGCGKEGEFYVLFQLSDAEKVKFVAELLPLVEQEEKKNRQKDANSGGISVQYNVTINDLSHCRGGIQQWEKWKMSKED